MRTYRTCVVLLLLAAATGGALARTATPPPAGQRVYDMKWLNINRWLCPFYNDGRYGIDITRGSGEAGGCWPAPKLNAYIFGAGMWFGSLKPRSDGKVDTLVTFGYNPNSGGTEITPTDAAHAAEGAGSPLDRVYVFPADWPPPQSRYGSDTSLVPQENFSLQDMWCTYCDLGEDNHIAPGYPQEVEFFQTIYAWNYPTNQDIFFITYKVRNAGADTLKNCYFGAVMDPDVGDAADDMVGLLLNNVVPGVPDTVKNVGYVGDYNNTEVQGGRWLWEGGTPGVVAYKFLESPRGPDGLPLGMTSFKKFTIDIDPVTDPAQYLTLAGYDYRSGVRSPYDSIDATPADKRFVQCSGPFNLAPGQVEVLIVGCIAAVYGGAGQTWEARGIDSLVHLGNAANTAQFIYDQGWLLPGPPRAPGIKLVPGDNTVRIVWDNIPETTVDPYWERVARDTLSQGYDPKYIGYDFQGYVVYKSADGSEWDIIAQCDLADSILFSYPPSGDSSLPDSLWIEAADNGLSYSVVDNRVTNGYEYFYCVTAYDYNYVTDSIVGSDTFFHPLILRSGIVANYSTIPRWDAANYLDPQTEIITVSGDTVNNGLELTSSVVVPYEVLADTYQVQFLAPGYLGPAVGEYQYYVAKKSDGSLVTDTLSFRYPVGTAVAFSLPVFNGQETRLSLDYDAPAKPVDTAYVVTGSYPTDRVRPARITAGEQKAVWCYRGSDYRVEWTTMGGGQLTARVYDVTNGGIEVMPTRFDTRQGVDANGWCFVNRIAQKPTDTLTTGAALLYIVGGYATLNYTGTNDTLGSRISEIHDGDVWMVTGHKEEGAAAYYNSYWLVARPGMEQVDSSYALDVKVVPNPYIVFNDWELNSDNRRVKFTHLPMTCTIRIFTMSGDLVTTVEHQDDGANKLDEGGTETWDFLNDNDQLIAAGVYIYHVQSDVGEATGKLVFIR